MKITVTILSEDILNKTWSTWLEGERERLGKLTETENWFLARRLPYGSHTISRRSNKAQRFEQWLFKHGAEVRQKAGKFHLEFTDETMATMFALKWS